jgi:hypothetical protein
MSAGTDATLALDDLSFDVSFDLKHAVYYVTCGVWPTFRVDRLNQYGLQDYPNKNVGMNLRAAIFTVEVRAICCYKLMLYNG